MTIKNENRISQFIILFFVLIGLAGIPLFIFKEINTLTFILGNIAVVLGILAQKLSIEKRKKNLKS